MRDASLDSSGYSPKALEVLLSFIAQLPFEIANELLSGLGLRLGAAELARVSEPYAEACRQEVDEQLKAVATVALGEGQGRVMVLQADGVMVLGRPEEGRCPGMEVKSAVLYPQASPSERSMIADIKEAKDFLPLMSGLLRCGCVRQQDTVVGLSDGASWLAELFSSLDIPQVIDVYHSSSYLDTVMTALAWSEHERQQERRSWLRGEIRARAWLKRYLPPPVMRRGWPPEAHVAVRYLETRLEHMDYPDYKAKGWPIGSGQVEGMNKNVIGNRMKRSGMHWSRPGAARMASLRAQVCAERPLVAFDSLRHKAFPVPRI
jgi:hypothetical protein